jgi:hypothetical protein
MKINRHLLITYLLLLFLYIPAQSQEGKFLVELKELLKEKDKYTTEKQHHIDEIRRMLLVPDMTPEQHYAVNKQLSDAYKTYLSDSAVHYVKKNLAIAEQLGRADWCNDARFELTSLYTVEGNYLDAFAELQAMDEASLSPQELIRYYDAYQLLYHNYAFNNPNAAVYIAKSKAYHDKLLPLLDKNSTHYLLLYADRLADEGHFAKAADLLLHKLQELHTDEHEKAVLAYVLGTIYKKAGNTAKEIEYFAISASCDIKNAIKENASMRQLASALYTTGDVEDAYLCIRSSMEDAIFCNANLRSDEVLQIFPIIEGAYQERVQQHNSDLRWALAAVGLVTLCLALAVFFVYRQMKRIAKIRRELAHKNRDLEELNGHLQAVVSELNSTNTALSEVNAELSETNNVKEAYIAQFFNLCSMYIDKLEKFQHALYKKTKDKNNDELLKMLRSNEMIDAELKQLYRLFDEVFLHLYPNFVEAFNALLLPEARFTVKPNEMNPELRIFALIRLGFTDSAKIASFLHYSMNTIYNYRTRVRNKALVPREEFEARVMRIGRNL